MQKRREPMCRRRWNLQNLRVRIRVLFMPVHAMITKESIVSCLAVMLVRLKGERCRGCE